MKKLIWLALFAAAPALADPPFCVVTQYGRQMCYYYSLDMCQQAAETYRGFCVYNPKR
jgi:hypothetical protein